MPPADVSGRKRRPAGRPPDQNKRLAAALELAGGATVKEAARAVRCSVTSIQNWRTEPRFKAMITEMRARFLERVLGRLSRTACGMVEILVDLAQNADSQATRRSAADSVLGYMLRVREHAVLDTRLVELEAELKDQAARWEFWRSRGGGSAQVVNVVASKSDSDGPDDSVN